jgi:uncharacterized protein
VYKRKLQLKITKTAKSYKAIALVGPRQSGKTTLAKMAFPKAHYMSLENPDHRSRAIDDPRLFIKSLQSTTILDEIQNTPDIFSYLQEILDDKSDKRRFILTGSNSFKLNEKISQSLAGRIRIFNILPLIMSELPADELSTDIDRVLHTGLYPKIYDEKLDPYEWFTDYFNTYIQKDIRSTINVSDLNQFDRFVRLCAGRAGQLSDYSAIASDAGLSQPTASRWASVLEASFLTFRLAPHFKNFNKKVIKTPKIYFYDTGLLCQLLGIASPDALRIHSKRGDIFENFVIAETRKHYFANATEPPMYFWRDQHGHEIDLLIEKGENFVAIEAKSGSTFQPDWLKNLKWFGNLDANIECKLIYGGQEGFDLGPISLHRWHEVYSMLE